MGMDVHVGLWLVHTAERSWAGIVCLVGGDAVLRIQREPALGAQVRRREAPGLLGRRGTGQAGAGAGTCTGDGWVLVDGAGWGLGGRGQAQRRQLVARQQRSLSRVVVVPGDISRTSGVDLRNRRQLQLFGVSRSTDEESVGKERQLGLVGYVVRPAAGEEVKYN